MKYKCVAAVGRGGVEKLRIVEKELHPPAAGEARIRVLAAGVCQDDVAARVGNRPFLPKFPFVPGYAILGTVDSIGEGSRDIAIGDRVAALTNYGGYSEYVYFPSEKLVRVPDGLDPAEAVTLILNYLVAYQVLHRVADVHPGEKALLIGASGGVGTAFLQLGRLAGLQWYGLASPAKHSVLAEYGVIPIDYRSQDFVQVLREAEPSGLDYVFNGMGEEYLRRGLSVLRRGGRLVHYGAPQSFPRFLRFLAEYLLWNLWPDGKTVQGYGTHTVDIALLKEDWNALFRLLEKGKIRPIIAETFPLLDAAKANALLEEGGVIGHLALLAPESR
jgi:NADPH:quinone reductase-like Zn-dependent oxidoreductase